MIFGDGSTVKIEGKGKIMLMCKNGEERALHDVYYIPNLRNNIISLGQMSEEGNRLVLRGEFFWIFDSREKLLMKVRRSPNRLYKIIIETSKQVCLITKVDKISKLWHARLGHVNYQAMFLVSRKKMVNGIPKINQSDAICDGCLMSKQTRKKFPQKANYSAKEVLELIHGDLCGPISSETDSSYKYFFLMVNDYSRFMWIYFLRSKDKALKAFKNFCALVENGSQKRVKAFRTDRGGEFTLNAFKEYCEGLRHIPLNKTAWWNVVIGR